MILVEFPVKTLTELRVIIILFTIIGIAIIGTFFITNELDLNLILLIISILIAISISLDLLEFGYIGISLLLIGLSIYTTKNWSE